MDDEGRWESRSEASSMFSAFDNEISPNYVKVEDTAATLTKDLNVDEKITLSSFTFKLTLKKNTRTTMQLETPGPHILDTL